MYALGVGGYLMKKYEPHDKQGSSISLQAFDDHAFFYKDAKSLWRMNVRDFNLARPGLAHEVRVTAPSIEKWKEWKGDVADGYFWADDLRRTRRELLIDGRSP